MLTPFFYMETIIGLRPTSETFDPNESDEDTINFNNKRASFGRYIENYHVTDDDEVSDE